MLKRKQLHQYKHPFDPHPFEAFWCGSWKSVERLRISGGDITVHIDNNGVVTEEDIPMSHLRIKSRKATCHDCTSFLRPGVEICVFFIPQYSKRSDEEKKEPVWIDAKIRSIERKPHDIACTCQFYVSFYINQGPGLMVDKKLGKEICTVNIDQISVLQKLELMPCETQYYRWGSSEDIFSLQQYKLFNGKFSAEITWLLVASVLKQTAFDVRSIHNHVVYEIWDSNHDKDQPNPHNHSYAVNFKVENEILTPIVIQYVPASLEADPDGKEILPMSYYDLMELRRSKRRNVQPERYIGCDDPYEIEVTRLGERKTYTWEYDEMPLALSVQADNEYQKHGDSYRICSSDKRVLSENNLLCTGNFKAGSSKNPRQQSFSRDKGAQENQLAIIPLQTNSLLEENPQFAKSGDHPKEIADYFLNFYGNGSPTFHKKKVPDFDFVDAGSGGSRKDISFRKHQTKRNNFNKRDCFYIRESIYDVRSFKKGSVSAQVCREMIKRCMENIDATLKNEQEQPPVVDQWKEFQTEKSSNKKEPDEKPSTINEEEMSEIDMLWKEMELALASWYLLDASEDSHVQSATEVQKSSKNVEKTCQHDYRLNEQIGTVCRLCGFVDTEIKDVLPPFSATINLSSNKEQKTEEDSENNRTEDGDVAKFSIPTSSSAPSTEGGGNVWALIPELGSKLRAHQKRAFEFLWRNIAGSLIPARMEKKKKKRGGCVISHSPGAGKTLLIIAFLVSYLKLFPGSRPLVLAPKTTLYTWYKEIIKWEVPIPVYQIHGGQTYKYEVLKQRMKLAPGLPRNQDVMHVVDCLEKMQRWLSHPSILLMGYTSFLTLTREDSNYAHRKYMAQLLKQCPGILVLDEGHNPRSTKSRLRKALMKVNTGLRVLLSGTLFQNNFGEYFNTLLLARPRFVNEVLKELDPKYKKRKKDKLTRFSLENRARKLLIDKISRKIDSNVEGERVQVLKTLKKLTSKFIDVHEGSSSDNLPGLQCYTLMMKSTSLQQELLVKLQHNRPVYKGFPLELELLITLGAIHPWLIRTTACSGQYFSPEELEDLEQYKFDMRSGSKVRFVMSLLPRCLLRKEKLLIFCHNIAPINLFIQIFERFYGWRKGREVLVLQGDIELFERGRVMDKFEEPGGPSKVMLASITACAEGISLTAASRVILLDSEWNPSKSKQAIARAFRPGQSKVVYVYQLLATGTLEEEKHGRTTWKEWVSSMIFSEEHVDDPSKWQAPKIEDELLREIVEEDRAALFHRIMKNEKASNMIGAKDILKKM